MTALKFGLIRPSTPSSARCELTLAVSNPLPVRANLATFLALVSSRALPRLRSFRSMFFALFPSRTGRAVGPCRPCEA
jgi:hypothetical protein